MKFTNKQLIIGVSVALIGALIMDIDISTTSAEQLRLQAEEAKREAMQADCQTIGNRILKCYSGEKQECEKLHESNAWFTNEYGATPQLLCPTGDFL